MHLLRWCCKYLRRRVCKYLDRRRHVCLLSTQCTPRSAPWNSVLKHRVCTQSRLLMTIFQRCMQCTPYQNQLQSRRCSTPHHTESMHFDLWQDYTFQLHMPCILSHQPAHIHLRCTWCIQKRRHLCYQHNQPHKWYTQQQLMWLQLPPSLCTQWHKQCRQHFPQAACRSWEHTPCIHLCPHCR